MSVGDDFHGSEQAAEKALKNWCGQCGKPYTETACGPTHAIMAAEWQAERLRVRTELLREAICQLICFQDRDPKKYSLWQRIEAELAKDKESPHGREQKPSGVD